MGHNYFNTLPLRLQLNQLAGLDMNHVGYKGSPPALQDVMGGSVPCGFLATTVVVPQVRSGKLKAFAVSSATRSVMAPELPTAREAGVPGWL